MEENGARHFRLGSDKKPRSVFLPMPWFVLQLRNVGGCGAVGGGGIILRFLTLPADWGGGPAQASPLPALCTSSAGIRSVQLLRKPKPSKSSTCATFHLHGLPFAPSSEGIRSAGIRARGPRRPGGGSGAPGSRPASLASPGTPTGSMGGVSAPPPADKKKKENLVAEGLKTGRGTK